MRRLDQSSSISFSACLLSPWRVRTRAAMTAAGVKRERLSAKGDRCRRLRGLSICLSAAIAVSITARNRCAVGRSIALALEASSTAARALSHSPCAVQVLEHGRTGPGQRRDIMRGLGEMMRGFGVVASARLDVQAAQTEQFGVRKERHFVEGGLGLAAIALELRRLSLEILGQGFARQVFLGFLRPRAERPLNRRLRPRSCRATKP